jgi:hypothetical protein
MNDRIERASKIQRSMLRGGYSAAAEQFLERAVLYSQREFDRIERGWLPRMRFTVPV